MPERVRDESGDYRTQLERRNAGIRLCDCCRAEIIVRPDRNDEHYMLEHREEESASVSTQYFCSRQCLGEGSA